MQIALG